MAENFPATKVPEMALSKEINEATRNHHTSLNRYITSRLPLCLPPYAQNTETYATGLQHFALVFLTFERLWDELITRHDTPTTSDDETLQSRSSTPPDETWGSFSTPSSDSTYGGGSTTQEDQLLRFLQMLRPEGIQRSARLRRDVAYLTGKEGGDTAEEVRQHPALIEYGEHIKRTLREKPWVLVAYAWCMYMAVFSGGRWIRSELCKQGTAFWTQGSPPPPANGDQQRHQDDNTTAKVDMDIFQPLGLSFWFFPGLRDGEDIKNDFKSRLEAGADILSPQMRQDIVEESKAIFDRCDGLVRELDGIFAQKTEEKKENSFLGATGYYAGLALAVSSGAAGLALFMHHSSGGLS